MSKSCNNVIIIHHIYSKVQNNLGIKFPTTHWHKGERPPSLLTKNKLWTYLLAWVCFLFESMFTSLFKNPLKRCPPHNLVILTYNLFSELIISSYFLIEGLENMSDFIWRPNFFLAHHHLKYSERWRRAMKALMNDITC
jgi:ABC-type multidrug transport system permease subunit